MINDQAKKLRQMVATRRKAAHQGVVVGILSGKGGVGKSVFSLNFAISLCRMKRSVLLVDLDVGMGDIDQMLGSNAEFSIADCILDKLRLEDVVFKGPDNLSCIAGGSGLGNLFQLDKKNLDAFLDQIEELRRRYDYVLLDFGAGVSENMLHFLLAAQRIILVTTPEPPAMADAYSALKILLHHNPQLSLFCVVNMVDNLQEGKDTWIRLSRATSRFMGTDISWLTALHRDKAVLRSVKDQIPCVVQNPRSRYSVEMRLLAASFLVGTGPDSQNALQDVSGASSFACRVRKYFRLLGGRGQ
jgi:flagellar biosynthesis protein FlhG